MANDELPWADVARWEIDNVVSSPGPGRPSHPRDVGVSLDALRFAAVPDGPLGRLVRYDVTPGGRTARRSRTPP